MIFLDICIESYALPWFKWGTRLLPFFVTVSDLIIMCNQSCMYLQLNY